MPVAAIIVAAGRGTRVGGAIPKQFQPLAGQSVLARTFHGFLSHGSVARVQPVIHADDRLLYEANLEFLGPTVRDRLAEPVLGGETRQSSVRNGSRRWLAALPFRRWSSSTTRRGHSPAPP